MSQTVKPLSNIQLELLKLFSNDIQDEDVVNIRRLIVKYFAQKAIEEANKVWDEKKWTDEDAERILQSHFRTPYTR